MLKLLTPRLTQLGRIAIGDKGEEFTTKGGGKAHKPVKLDYFRLTTNQRDAAGRLIVDAPLMQTLGDKPTALRIALPFDDIEANVQTRLAYYRGRTLFCHGDGETAQRLTVTNASGSAPEFGAFAPFGPCGEACPDFQARRCKPNARLNVILAAQEQIGGVYVFRTTSWTSIRNILAGLVSIKAETGGVLAWIPLLLRLVPHTVYPKEGGAAQLAYVVQLVFDGALDTLLATVKDRLAVRAPLLREIRQLEALLRAVPFPEETPEEQREIAEEFYPETAAQPLTPALDPDRGAEPTAPETGRDAPDDPTGEDLTGEVPVTPPTPPAHPPAPAVASPPQAADDTEAFRLF